MTRIDSNTPEPPRTTEANPRNAYLAALKRYDPPTLARLCEVYESEPQRPSSGRLADLIESRGAIKSVLDREPAACRLVLGLFGLADSPTLPADGVVLTLRTLGFDPTTVLRPLLLSGLLATRFSDIGPPPSLEQWEPGGLGSMDEFVAHPEAIEAGRLQPPEGERPPCAGPASLVREADGLEPILRLAALWQRVRGAPLRRTQQGTLFKRDRERLDDDRVLAGPIGDSLEPLPDQVALWLALAEGVGLLERETDGDRTLAAPADFWTEHSVHLPQMLGARWLGLRRWQEQGGWQEEGTDARLSAPFARVATLLWLATLEPEEWVALDDLAAHLDARSPDWSRPALSLPIALPTGRKSDRSEPNAEGRSVDLLRAILLGPAYQLGLVRAAEESPSRRRIVQLTEAGRYALGLGPPPRPRETFEEFLFVQPNFEIIAYRQGLNPWLAGLFCRFLDWTQIGSALEMRLSAESVYRGLEGGLSPEQILDRLERHSGRRLPSGVGEALRTWAGRRARLAYFASATLVEFASPSDLNAALSEWSSDSGQPEPIRVSDRLLLLSDESAIPLARVRIVGSRDYRRPPEPCVEVGPGGVELAVDIGRSDLFVESEMARLAEPIAEGAPSRRVEGPPRRRFQITPGSLSRALAEGMTPTQVERWFEQRTGGAAPPAVRLLLLAAGAAGRTPLRAGRPVVLRTPSADLLEGLYQHPATAPLLGDRLGPDSAVVPEGLLNSLRTAIAQLGLVCEVEEDRPGRTR